MSSKKQSQKANGVSHSSTGLEEMPVLAEAKLLKKSKAALPDARLFDTSESLPTGSYSESKLLHVLTEVRNGNFRVRMPIDETGIKGKICDTLNEIISLNERMMEEFTKAGSTIGK